MNRLRNLQGTPSRERGGALQTLPANRVVTTLFVLGVATGRRRGAALSGFAVHILGLGPPRGSAVEGSFLPLSQPASRPVTSLIGIT
jgi:hypothetical protein